MPANRPNPKRRHRRKTGALVSQSSILILSGFLLGTMFSSSIPQEVRTYAHLAGTCGMIAYVGLRFVSVRYLGAGGRLSTEEAVSKLESRIDRHVARLSAARKRKPFQAYQDTDRQYVTVVRS